ncbi:MAG TPA: sigma factor-like helix-turn-helix DNA-binding protein [Candidatus Saccharimonadales bacterium]|nr:sigma factor-like helix-turn-helix DNA-binding protein [Candidatus Saccharimonadales bacterium]
MSPEVASQGLEQKLPAKQDFSVPEPFPPADMSMAPPEPQADIVITHDTGAHISAEADIDPISLILELRRQPDFRKIEDSLEANKLVDRTVVFLQREMAEKAGDKHPMRETAQFTEALQWLKTTLYPIDMKFARRYVTNSRFELDDFMQVLNAHLVKDHIPKYNPSKSHFLYYYKGFGWQRLQEQVYLSASQLSTTTHFGQVDSEAKDRAFAAISYDGLDFGPDTEGSAGLDFYISESDDDAVIRPIVAQDILRRVAQIAEDRMTKLESTTFALYLEGRTHDEIAAIIGVKKKSVDNALQKVRKKLTYLRSTAMKDFILTANEPTEEQQAA